MQNKVFITKATQADDRKLFDLSVACNPLVIFDPKTYWIACNYYQEYTYMIYINDQIAGYILATANDDTVIIHQICVLPAFRHCGTAQILLDTIVRIAKEKKKAVHIIYNPTNTAIAGVVNKFCETNGYEVKEVKMYDYNRFNFQVYHIMWL